MFKKKNTPINLVNTKLVNLSKINFIFLYIFFLFLTSLLSFVFYEKFITLYPQLVDINGSLVYKNLPFEFGKLIENLIKYHEYSVNLNISNNSIDFYLSRLPFLPLLILILNLFSTKLLIIIIIKNITFFSIIFFTLFYFAKEKGYKIISFFMLLLIFFYNPFNLKIITNFVYADFITSVLLPVLFLIIISNLKLKYFYFGLILFILYLTKTNMFFICLGLSFFVFFYEKKILPLLFVLLAIITWGSFGFVKTGKFPIASSLLSTNSHAMATSLNKDFHKFYPLISVDYIDICSCSLEKQNTCDCKPKEIKNEWDYYNYYKNLNIKYLSLNKIRFIKDIFLKIKTIFFNIYKDGQIYEKNKKIEKKIIYSLLINKILLLISITVAMYYFFKNFKSGNYKIELYFLIIFFLSMPPFLIGWALSRHLVFLFLISQLYLFIKFKSNYR